MIEPGTRFGSFEVAGSIGAGGMGEVWRARDTELKRDVALKVLPSAFVEDADRLARFRREAEMLAALNHANIAQVYGIANTDGQTAIVMELVEGPTLEDRIREGPIPADEAMGVAMQVVAALEAAHEKGIVHRDLKPANVKVKDDGTVKVLDFGISKPMDADAISGGSAIATPAVTQTGVILGTAAYMSPEQARGKFVDQRTDIWAFGCLLFEMLTGQPAFRGEDVMLTLARVLANDTNLDSIPGTISPAVRHTISLCLEKDPKRRIADIRDVRLALEGRFETELPRAGSEAIPEGILQRAAIPVAALVAGILLTAGAFWSLSRPEPSYVDRFVHVVPVVSEQPLGINAPVAVSPDGRTLVYAMPDGLYSRSLDQIDAQPIAGTQFDDISFVFFSPDGDRLAFARGASFSGGGLFTVPLGGGRVDPVVAFDNTPPFTGGSWSPDDTILYSTVEGIFRINAAGGDPTIVVAAEENRIYRRPQLLPDGDSILVSLTFREQFQGMGQADPATQIVVVSQATGEIVETLFSVGGDARYVSTGHIVYARDDELYAVAFDADSLTVSGSHVPIEPGIARGAQMPPRFFAWFDATPDGGTLAYRQGGASQAFRALLQSRVAQPRPLIWVDDTGAETVIAGLEDYSIVYADLRSDGTLVVQEELPAAGDSGPVFSGVQSRIWTADVARPVINPLLRPTDEAVFDPIWVDDDRVIVAYDSGLAWLHLNRDGSLEPLSVPNAEGELRITGLTPDGSNMLVNYGELSFAEREVDFTRLRVGLLPVEPDDNGEHPIEPLIRHESSDGRIDPLGEYIVYVSRDSGDSAIYIDNYPGLDDRQPLSNAAGGYDAYWSPDGDAVYYLRNDDRLMKVTIERSPSLLLGDPVVISEAPYFTGIVAVDADNGVLLATRGVARENSGEEPFQPEIVPLGDIVVIQGFGEDLKRRVPAD